MDIMHRQLQPLTPSDIGLILSYRCQCECKHCLYNCGKDWEDWMSPHDVDEALEMMAGTWAHPFQVHITGGEPFLNFPILLHAVEKAVSLNIPCYLETNAGWCVREQLVEDRFSALRDAGLGAVLISCSPFHSESIPLSRTLQAIRTGVDVFGSQGVIVYRSEWLELISQFDIDAPVPLVRYRELYGRSGAGRALWEWYGLIGGGRAGHCLGDLTRRSPVDDFRFDKCKHEILYAPHSHMDLYGNYISGFCGGLAVGSWRELLQLMDDFEREDYPFPYDILIHTGPYGLYGYARDEGYRSKEDGYVDKCHLCVDVRKWLSDNGVNGMLRLRKFYEVL